MAILKYLRKKGKYAGSIGSGKVDTPTASKPGHMSTLGDINRQISDPSLINLDDIFKALEQTELGKEWKSNPTDRAHTRKRIQETLDYLILADGRFGTFFSASAHHLGITIIPPINKKTRKASLVCSLDRKAKLETIINDGKADDITKHFANLSLDLLNQGDKLAEEMETYHALNKANSEPWNLRVHIPSREDQQARYQADSKRTEHTYIPLTERVISYTKRTKEISDFLEESRKTALTPDQWIKKFEKKSDKAGRVYLVMTEHWRNGVGFNDDDGRGGIRLTREEYNNRKSYYSPKEIKDALISLKEANADLVSVRKVFISQ